MLKSIAIAIPLTLGLAGFALAQEAAQEPAQGIVSFDSTDSFDDVMFNLENAVIEQGLAIENKNHIGDMLERTRADVGSDVVIYDHAEVISFCSATLSRMAMEADPMNIAYCPYTIFAYQTKGSDTVTVGYRSLPDGPMQEVQALLKTIATAGAGQ